MEDTSSAPSETTEDRTVRTIEERAIQSLRVIETAIHHHPGTGQAGRLVRFIAGCYNGSDYPFDLTDLRGLDSCLANACLHYLNYDRLGITEIHKHLTGGDKTLHQWLRYYRDPKGQHETSEACVGQAS